MGRDNARTRVAGGLIGVVFGITLCWSGMSSPVVIREALLLQRSYLFLFFASAVLVATAGTALLRRRGARAVLTGERIAWTAERPRRRHVTGSVLFGLGWGIADACPAPIATQVGQGIGWALFTIAGVFAGVWLHQRGRAGASEPATPPLRREPASVQPAASP